MNDPHVVTLHYKVEHNSSIDYSSTEPLEYHYDTFDVRVEDKDVRFSMHDHFATEREARNAVDDFIRSWELDATLMRGPNAFNLRFFQSESEDRNPTPGVICVQAGPVRFNFAVSEVEITLSPGTYPRPPSTPLKRTPDVESMYRRYTGYCEGKEPLTSMAYFCLTVLEASTGESIAQRSAAATRYCISKQVLDRMGELSSKKGGAYARKAEGVHHSLTPQGKQFLEAAVKTIIRRAAEVASDPDTPITSVTLHDLPQT